MAAGDGRVRVVIADDHPFFRDGLSRGLSRDGRVEVVAEAENGREALEAMRQEQPDVALVDYQMPELDGLAIVRAAVRDQLPTRARCPLIRTARSCSRHCRRAPPATCPRTPAVPRSSRRC
jgi:DNA-binding NarL/FixJ family response regulator